MMCDPKKCKKCGMWWTIKGHDTETMKPFEYQTCGHKAIHLELCKMRSDMLGLRQDTQTRGNKAVEGLSLLMPEGRPRIVGG